MKIKIIYILIALSFGSCVVPRNYSRAKEKVDRIVDKFPEILQNDTIIVTTKDTIITPEVLVDTVFKASKGDTIYIEKEKLRIRFIRGKRDSIFLEAECLPDTIVVTKRIPVPVYTVEKHNLIKGKFLGLSYWIWALIGFCLFLLLIIIFRRRSRPSE